MVIGTLLIIFHTWQRWSGRKYIQTEKPEWLSLNASEGTVNSESGHVSVRCP
jgi:hypothetical protein